MDNACYRLGLYLHLVRASDLRQRPLVRDRLLVLAGVVAVELKLDLIAASCRGRILSHNRAHLLRRWPTMTEAIADEEFQQFVQQLWRRYPLEKAERMLSSLGIQMGQERETYFSDLEYAAALLGSTPEQLKEEFGTPGS